MAAFHHGISAQEVVQGILPMRNANTSVLGLIVTSTDADDTMYPVGTPVLLTGITQDNIDKAGTDGTLRDCLQTIRDIHNPTVVVLRVSASFEADSLDILLTCPARFGLMPKRFGAPELDTPDVVLKLVSIAKRRRGIVYASPRLADGTLITDKAAIVAYRDTYGDREISIIDGEWGVPISNVLCTPSHTNITGVWNIEGGFDFTYLTYSRNGGDLQTVNLLDMTPEQQSLLVMQSLYLSADNTNFAFVDSSIMPEVSPILESNGKVTLAASGIDTNGDVVFFGDKYSLIGVMVQIPNGDYVVDNVLPEQNTIEIHRTQNTLAMDDAYTYFKTEQTNDEPVVMTSCAKAVIKLITL